IVADDLGELVLVLAEVGLEIDLDAAILEDLNGSGRQGVGDENARGGHGCVPIYRLCSSVIARDSGQSSNRCSCDLNATFGGYWMAGFGGACRSAEVGA